MLVIITHIRSFMCYTMEWKEIDWRCRIQVEVNVLHDIPGVVNAQ